MNAKIIGIIVGARGYFSETTGKSLRLVIYCESSEMLAIVICGEQIANIYTEKLAGMIEKRTKIIVRGNSENRNGKIITIANRLDILDPEPVVAPAPEKEKAPEIPSNLGKTEIMSKPEIKS